jgi:hypothetical protein
LEVGVLGAELHGAELPCEEGGVEVACQVELACAEELESDGAVEDDCPPVPACEDGDAVVTADDPDGKGTTEASVDGGAPLAVS